MNSKLSLFSKSLVVIQIDFFPLLLTQDVWLRFRKKKYSFAYFQQHKRTNIYHENLLFIDWKLIISYSTQTLGQIPSFFDILWCNSDKLLHIAKKTLSHYSNIRALLVIRVQFRSICGILSSLL